MEVDEKKDEIVKFMTDKGYKLHRLLDGDGVFISKAVQDAFAKAKLSEVGLPSKGSFAPLTPSAPKFGPLGKLPFV